MKPEEAGQRGFRAAAALKNSPCHLDKGRSSCSYTAPDLSREVLRLRAFDCRSSGLILINHLDSLPLPLRALGSQELRGAGLWEIGI
jgi:hypothetical protein